jgi:hypothetical protein
MHWITCFIFLSVQKLHLFPFPIFALPICIGKLAYFNRQLGACLYTNALHCLNACFMKCPYEVFFIFIFVFSALNWQAWFCRSRRRWSNFATLFQEMYFTEYYLLRLDSCINEVNRICYFCVKEKRPCETSELHVYISDKISFYITFYTYSRIMVYTNIVLHFAECWTDPFGLGCWIWRYKEEK